MRWFLVVLVAFLLSGCSGPTSDLTPDPAWTWGSLVLHADPPDSNIPDSVPWNVIVQGAGVIVYRDSLPNADYRPLNYRMLWPDTLFIVP